MIEIRAIVRLIQVYANNIVFTHKSNVLLMQNHYKLIIISISLCYLFIHTKLFLFFFAFFIFQYNAGFIKHWQPLENLKILKN